MPPFWVFLGFNGNVLLEEKEDRVEKLATENAVCISSHERHFKSMF